MVRIFFFGVFFDTWNVFLLFYLGFCVFRPFSDFLLLLSALACEFLCVWYFFAVRDGAKKSLSIRMCAVILLCVHTVIFVEVFGVLVYANHLQRTKFLCIFEMKIHTNKAPPQNAIFPLFNEI